MRIFSTVASELLEIFCRVPCFLLLAVMVSIARCESLAAKTPRVSCNSPDGKVTEISVHSHALGRSPGP